MILPPGYHLRRDLQPGVHVRHEGHGQQVLADDPQPLFRHPAPKHDSQNTAHNFGGKIRKYSGSPRRAVQHSAPGVDVAKAFLLRQRR